MKKVYKLAEEIDKRLTVYNFSHNNVVMVKCHCDNSFFLYGDAFAVSYEEWFMVFTEHAGFHVYHGDEYNVIQFTECSMPEYINDMKFVEYRNVIPIPDEE